MDRSRPSPSSPRLPVCGPVQSDLPIRPDWTEPYRGPGSSGLVESLILMPPELAGCKQTSLDTYLRQAPVANTLGRKKSSRVRMRGLKEPYKARSLLRQSYRQNRGNYRIHNRLAEISTEKATGTLPKGSNRLPTISTKRYLIYIHMLCRLEAFSLVDSWYVPLRRIFIG
jgi:hypothetical protein